MLMRRDSKNRADEKQKILERYYNLPANNPVNPLSATIFFITVQVDADFLCDTKHNTVKRA